MQSKKDLYQIGEVARLFHETDGPLRQSGIDLSLTAYFILFYLLKHLPLPHFPLL